MPARGGASLERSIAILSIVVFAGLLLAALTCTASGSLSSRPRQLFPALLADLQFWLWKYGQPDPDAPLADAVGEFTRSCSGLEDQVRHARPARVR
jgi:hypothetical protein